MPQELTKWSDSFVWNVILELFPKLDLKVRMTVFNVQLGLLAIPTQEQLNASNVLQEPGKTRELIASPALEELILALGPRAVLTVLLVLQALFLLCSEEQAHVPPVTQGPMKRIVAIVTPALLELPQRLEFQAVLGVLPAPQGILPLKKGQLNARNALKEPMKLMGLPVLHNVPLELL